MIHTVAKQQMLPGNHKSKAWKQKPSSTADRSLMVTYSLSTQMAKNEVAVNDQMKQGQELAPLFIYLYPTLSDKTAQGGKQH